MATFSDPTWEQYLDNVASAMVENLPEENLEHWLAYLVQAMEAQHQQQLSDYDFKGTLIGLCVDIERRLVEDRW